MAKNETPPHFDHFDRFDSVSVVVDGREISVPAGSVAAAAIAVAGHSRFRNSVSGTPRGPLCGMGVCFECRVTIEGVPNVRSCRTVCRQGMEIRTDAP